MRNHRPPVLVIGGGSANGLGIARNLGRRGIPVYCVTSNPQELTCFSRYCTGYTVIPDVEANSATMRRALDAVYHKLACDCVVYPTTDTAMLTFARIYPTLNHHRAVIPDEKTVDQMVIKSQFYRSLHSSGIPYPKTFSLEDTSLTELVKQVPFPVFVRPAQTLHFIQYFRGKGFVARTPRELHRYIQLARQRHIEVMVQEIIPGPPENGYIVKGYFTWRGTLAVLITKQKVWQPSLFANAAISVTIPHSQVSDFSQPFLTWLKRQQYRGLFGAEFKRDARDGQVKLLEVNARSTGDSYMGRACGADDILTAYHDALGRGSYAPSTYQIGVHYVNEVTSVLTLLNHLLHEQPIRLGDLGRILSKKYFPLFSRADPIPTVIGVRDTLKQLRRGYALDPYDGSNAHENVELLPLASSVSASSTDTRIRSTGDRT